MTKVISIFGPPGTGKTTALVKLTKEKVDEGFKVAVISYTKAAAAEITDRLDAHVRKSIAFIGTLHSCAYNLIQEDVIELVDQKEFKEEFGDCSVYYKLMKIYNHMRINDLSLEESFDDLDVPIFFNELEDFYQEYLDYKKKNHAIDYFDLVDLAKEKCLENQSLRYDILIVDEAQDLNHGQYRLAQALVKEDGILYLAGDDDQAIFSFQGSDASIMIDNADEKIFLTQSYRLPENINRVAMQYVRNIEPRQEKTWKHKECEYSGGVMFINVDEYDPYELPESHVVLALSKYGLKPFARKLIGKNIEYSTFNKSGLFETGLCAMIRYYEKKNYHHLRAKKYLEYVQPRHHRKLKRKDQKANFKEPWYDFFDIQRFPQSVLDYAYEVNILAKPKIHLSTIHSFKGKEHENIVLNAYMSNSSREEFKEDPDTFMRKIYVGLTRAKKRLYIYNDTHIRIFIDDEY